MSSIVSDALQAWESGWEIIGKALHEAERGELPTATDCRKLDDCHAMFPEPREFAKAARQSVSDIKRFLRAPWWEDAGGYRQTIGYGMSAGDDLLRCCKDVIARNQKRKRKIPVNWKQVEVQASEVRAWFANMVESESTTESGDKQLKWSESMTLRTLAKKFGVSERTIRRWRDAGEKSRVRIRQFPTREQWQYAIPGE